LKKEELREKTLKEAKELSFALIERFPYEKLYLFGSALKKRRYNAGDKESKYQPFG